MVMGNDYSMVCFGGTFLGGVFGGFRQPENKKTSTKIIKLISCWFS